MRRYLRLLKGCSCIAGVILLLAPLIAVAIYSFNASRTGLVWGGWTLRWYADLFGDPTLLSAAWNTLVLAAVSTGMATLLGTLLALGLERFAPKHGRSTWLDTLVELPLITPDILFAVAIVIALAAARTIMPVFEPGLTAMIIGHVTFQISFVALLVRARLAMMGPTLSEAAADLGATPSFAFRRITLPLLAPAIAAGAILAAVLSMDDFVISFFTAGPGSDTLPIYIYGSLRRGLSPKIHALSTVLIAGVAIGLSLLEIFRGAAMRPMPR